MTRTTANILLLCPGIGQRFGQAHHITHPQVKALPGNRVERLRGISNQHSTM